MMATAEVTDFRFEVSDHAPGRNLPQRVGSRLWFPMFLMAVMAFPVGLALGGALGDDRRRGDPTTIAALGHFVTAANFVGFTSVFAAISFAIARILGELRVGRPVPGATGRRVETLEMPRTAKVFLALMALAMMTLLGSVIATWSSAPAWRATASAWSAPSSGPTWLEGVRRAGIGVFLFAIAFGLATIVSVIRFQVARLQELPREVATR
jgi:hypothetical protein